MSPAPPPAPGRARFPGRDGELRFDAPVNIVQANLLKEVRPALEKAAQATRAGRWVAGFVSYEAAAAIDFHLAAHPSIPGLPLLWFGVYDKPLEGGAPAAAAPYRLGPWTPLIDRGHYAAGIDRIRALIAAGDTYQVNYTFPMEAAFDGDAEAWFNELCAAQAGEHCAYLDTGRHAIVSASPELFFTLNGGGIRVRPMKGTRPRGRWPDEDRALAAALQASAKERAENVMIVDLLRNDLGRIARTGTVRVESLFDLERYPTVWQLTSRIEAETNADWAETLATLFPSGSVTGAPKIRTMQIIRAVEPHPRGVYCGAIGWAGPDGVASFSVAIRTATVDRATGTARYPVGGGITWDSATEAEYAECADKAGILSHRMPAFDLLETMRFDEGECVLLARHLDRLEASADYFGFAFERGRILEALAGVTGSWRVRLTVSRAGVPSIETAPLPSPCTFRVAWGAEPVDERDVFLFHKTTHREVYDRARAAAPGADDVLLTNRRGEVTEGCIGNLVVEMDGVRCTPPIACGLLGGVQRAESLARGEIIERVLTRSDVEAASRCWLINAVRGWIPIKFGD